MAKQVRQSSAACCITAGTAFVITLVQVLPFVCPSDAYMPSSSANCSSRTSGTRTSF